MKKRTAFKMSGFIFLLLLLALSVGSITAFGALVQEDEAVAIADFWYAMELNSKHIKFAATEKADRLDKLQDRQVLYLVSKDDLLDTPPIWGDILAYIVKYDPSGFVVVSGEDRIIPILVFDVESEFRWDQPILNFLRYYVGKEMVNRWEYLRENAARGLAVPVHHSWSYLRSRLQESIDLKEVEFEAGAEPIYLEWETAHWGQCDFYNDTVSAHNGSDPCIPTGCTATAMAIKMRFHEWPGTGNSSHGYNDNDGSIQFSHSVNFSDQTYNWGAMPTTDLTQANARVANLMYHCGVAVDMDYELGCCGSGPGSGAWPTAYSMNTYFGYIEATDIRSSFDTPIKDSVRAGLPVVLSSSKHTVVCDGYRETQLPYFHLNAGYGGGGSWYNLNQMPWGPDPTIDYACPYCQPPNYVYVDKDYTGSETGVLRKPYNTFSEGYTNCPDKGHLWLKGPKPYVASPTVLSKRMTIHSYEGDSTVQQ